MRLESEVRRSSILEQHYVHGRWRIIKVYVKGDLREIIVKRREEYHT
jgi:hypothetical protein